MKPSHCASAVALAAALWIAGAEAAKVKIRTEHDKAFNFAAAKTYAWHPDGAGDVKILIADAGDPKALLARFDPVVRPAVEAELARRNLVKATSGQPDLHINYYVLFSAGTSAQTTGQFLPPMVEWGLPPFMASTSSFQVFEQGSLILDMSSPVSKSVVWRGAAATEVDRTRTRDQQDTRIRDAIKDMLKKFPPKK
jgi:hypothetical protein